jgi:hypothetical protein
MAGEWRWEGEHGDEWTQEMGDRGCVRVCLTRPAFPSDGLERLTRA